MQRRCEHGVSLDKPGQITENSIEDRAIAMCFIDAFADVREQARVVDLHRTRVVRIDHTGVQRRFTQRIERVDEVSPTSRIFCGLQEQAL